MNGTAELLSGLSNVPLFFCGLAMCLAAAQSGGRGKTKRNWIIISVLLCFTLLLGIFVHTVKLSTGFLRVFWPFVFFLITELVRRFWIQMVRIFRGSDAEKRFSGPVTAFGYISAAVDGLLEYFLGMDLAPLFCIFGVPASLHILWMAVTAGNGGKKKYRRAVIMGMLFMFASTLADGMIRRPVDILGIPCTGALLGHILLLAALVMLIRMIRISSREEEVEA